MKSVITCITGKIPAPKNRRGSVKEEQSPTSRESVPRKKSWIRLPSIKLPFFKRRRVEETKNTQQQQTGGTNTPTIDTHSLSDTELEQVTTPTSSTNPIPHGFKKWTPREEHEFPFRMASLDESGRWCFSPPDEGLLDETMVKSELNELRKRYLAGSLSGCDFPEDQAWESSIGSNATNPLMSRTFSFSKGKKYLMVEDCEDDFRTSRKKSQSNIFDTADYDFGAISEEDSIVDSIEDSFGLDVVMEDQKHARVNTIDDVYRKYKLDEVVEEPTIRDKFFVRKRSSKFRKW